MSDANGAPEPDEQKKNPSSRLPVAVTDAQTFPYPFWLKAMISSRLESPGRMPTLVILTIGSRL